jgi:predicted nucleic acid-binding protein
MRYLLDSTVLIDHALGRFGATPLLHRLFEETGELYTCDAVVAETISKGDPEELASVESLVAALEYVATSPEAARYAGRLRRERPGAGRRWLGDALIAGVAWHLDATVVTRNPRDFDDAGVPVLAYGPNAQG